MKDDIGLLEQFREVHPALGLILWCEALTIVVIGAVLGDMGQLRDRLRDM